MVFHNDADKYIGFEPPSAAFSHDPNNLEVPNGRAGLFFRDDIPRDTEAITEQFVSYPAEGCITDYQFWVDNAWKRPHTSTEAAGRFSGKLAEEYKELSEAFDAFSTSNKDEHRDAVVSELGDVLWSATALANNSHVDVETGLRMLLFRYTLGIREFGDNRVPSWHGLSARICTQADKLHINDIDELTANGFEALPSPVMNVDSSESYYEDYHENLSSLLMEAMKLSHIVEKQYDWDSDSQAYRGNTYIYAGGLHADEEEVADAIARIYIRIGFMARVIGSTLAEVTQRNVIKISQRANAGLIDKTDGPRH